MNFGSKKRGIFKKKTKLCRFRCRHSPMEARAANQLQIRSQIPNDSFRQNDAMNLLFEASCLRTELYAKGS